MRRTVPVLALVALLVPAVLVGAHLLASEKLAPDDLLKLGDTYLREKTYKKALDAYDRFLKAAPDHAKTFEAHMGRARAMLGLRQWYQAVEQLKPVRESTAAGSLERAEVTSLMGATMAGRSGGSRQVVEWLDEAEGIFREKGKVTDRIRTLFALGRALSYSWDYGIAYEVWEKAHYRKGETPEVTWQDYLRKRMEEQDQERYDRTVKVYRGIMKIDGGGGHDSALARYRLGCFHVNVLASAFATRANYYPVEEPEASKKREELMARYVAELRKGLAVFGEIVAKHRGDSLADDALYLTALVHHRRLNEFPEAATAYESLLAGASGTEGSEWLDTARAALQEIRREEIRMRVRGPQLPGKSPELELQARNVAEISIRAYRIDLSSLLRGSYRFHRLETIDVSGQTPFAEWELDTGAKKDLVGVRKSLELPFSTAGAFLILAEGQRSTCRALVIVSGLGMAMKTGSEEVLLYGADAVTGEPREGVRFVVKASWRVRREEFTRLFEGVSDANGLASVDVSGLSGTGARMEVVGTKQDDVVLSHSWRSARGGQELFKVFSHTDRPVYRPNQTVHFKCVVRAAGEAGYRAVDRKPVKVEITDPRGQKLFTKTLLTSPHGTVSGDLALGEEPPLGAYQIRTFVDGKQYYCFYWTGAQFRVEEYKKPEFQVKVEAGDSQIRPGTAVTAKVSARYYFGAPVKNADLTWRVFRQPYRHFIPVKRRYSWYYRDIFPAPSARWGRELIAEGTGLTDEDGRYEIGFTSKAFEDEMDSRYFVEASVTDQSRRQIDGRAALFATKQPFFVRAELRRALWKPGDRVEVTIRAEDANRKPVASEGKLVLARRVDREEEKDGKKVPVIDWEEVGSVAAKTGPDGDGMAGIVVDREGQFRLSYVTAGEGGEEIRADGFAWVVTKDFRGSQYRFSGVEVTTDRDTYGVGDKVDILVNSHVEGAWLLVTVEADRRILERKVVRAMGRTHLMTLTAREVWTPNVFVKALTIRDESVFLNRRQIVIPPVSKFLEVKLTPKKEGTYLPGEKAEFNVSATDASGEPTTAELSVGFIDKSVLYIAPDQTPDIRQFFYGKKRGDGVSVSSSFDFGYHGTEKLKPGVAWVKYRTRGRPQYMNPWFYSFNGWRSEVQQGWGAGAQPQGGGFDGGPTEKRRSRGGGAPPPGSPATSMGKAGRADKGEAADEEMESGDDSAPGQRSPDDPTPPAADAAPRKFFPDTAFWNAHVVTGQDGKATVSFPFPDSLTTWKATARGATDDTAVGSAEREFVTTKHVIMRVSAPRFFRERDELVVSGIVHNEFEEPISVRVTVADEGGCLEMLDRGELSRPDQTFTIAPHKAQRVDWWYRVLRSGTVKIHAAAKSERESDAVVLSFPAYEHGVEKYVALAGSFVGTGGTPAEGGKAEMRFVVPEERHEDATELMVKVSPSLAAVLLESLPYLADYPYGCVEQTMSRFLPTVVVKKTLLDLGFTLEDLGVDPEREVPAGYWGRKETQKLKVLRGEDLDRIVGQGLQRLKDFQHSDGAWGWWKSSPRDLYMTAYVVRGLALARRAGAPVDEQVIRKGAIFLFSQLKSVDPKEAEEKGMALGLDLLASVTTALLETAKLSGEAQALIERIADHVYERREKLGATSRALLAISLHRLGREDDAKIVCENLTDLATIDRENGTCRIGRAQGFRYWHDDAVEATATSLRAYLLVMPKSEMIPMMVRWLVGNRRGSHWSSTKATALAALALCDYLKVSKELDPDLTVKISVDGRIAKTVRITRENVFTADNLYVLRGAAVASGEHVVTVESEGRGNLYYTASLEFFTREEDVKGAGNGIRIDRKVYRVHQRKRDVQRKTWVKDHYEERTVTEVYEEREPLAQNAAIKVGDEIEVELNLTAANDYRYLVFEDMKGAGFEPVELLSGSSWSGLLSYKEYRDERVALFCSSMSQGEHRIAYRLRAEIPGDFHVMPTAGHAMYLPEIRAISDEFRITITESGVR